MRIPVLTVHEPWATLLVAGMKTYETRGWSTSYRGPMLVHAGKVFPEDVKQLVTDRNDVFYRALRRHFDVVTPGAVIDKLTARLGHIVGIVSVIGCMPTEIIAPKLRVPELAFGDFSLGRYGWHCSRPRDLFDTVTCAIRGAQGLWNLPPELAPLYEPWVKYGER